MNHPRILLVDDSEDFLAELRAELCAAFDVLDSVSSGDAAILAAARLDPDLIILDIAMPGTNGIHAARLLRAQSPRSRIVILTINEQAEYVAAAFAAGVSAYVTKRRLSADLPPAIAAALQGATFLSPTLRR